MDLGVILGSASVATLISCIFSFFIGRKRNKLEYITQERGKWRTGIKDLVRKIAGFSYEEKDGFLACLQELRVNINILGIDPLEKSIEKDSSIWVIINQFERNEIKKKDFEETKRRLISNISLMLKLDWERSKSEVKGVYYSLIESGLVLFLMFIIIAQLTQTISGIAQETNSEIVQNIGVWVMVVVIYFLLCKMTVGSGVFLYNDIKKINKKMARIFLKIFSGALGVIYFCFIFQTFYQFAESSLIYIFTLLKNVEVSKKEILELNTLIFLLTPLIILLRKSLEYWRKMPYINIANKINKIT